MRKKKAREAHANEELNMCVNVVAILKNQILLYINSNCACFQSSREFLAYQSKPMNSTVSQHHPYLTLPVRYNLEIQIGCG